jgi:hypothetical protein
MRSTAPRDWQRAGGASIRIGGTGRMASKVGFLIRLLSRLKIGLEHSPAWEACSIDQRCAKVQRNAWKERGKWKLHGSEPG